MSRAALWVAGALLAANAAAQIVVPPAAAPGAMQQREMDEERRRQELERLQRKPVTEPLKQESVEKPAAKPQPDAVKFLVREIEFTDSEILSKEELESVARDYRGKHLSLADLQQLAERVNALYRAKGVVTAQAVIPPQDVSEGVVRVRLVEGRVGRIRIEGNESTAEGYIKWRVAQQPGRLVDLQSLERELIRFNRTTDVQLQAELKPGEAFGTTDLNLAVIEPPRHDLRFFVDNAGTTPTGEWREGVTYRNRSVFGWRDDLSLSANYSDGHQGYSASYGVPFNRLGGRATYSYYKDYTAIKYGPTAPLNITGESEANIISLRQPTYVTSHLQLDLTGGAKKRNSVNWISGIFLQGAKTEDANLGAEIQMLDSKGSWLANYSLSAGHAYLINRTNYSVGRGSLRRLHSLGGAWSALGSFSFQHTDTELLPASEQFYIGGEGSVRGYPVGTFSGDQGYTVNLELNHPIGVLRGEGAAELAANGFFFVDYGNVRPFRPPDSTLRAYEELTSVGWGLNVSIGKGIFTCTTLAYGLNDIPQLPRSYKIHFQLFASVF